MPQGHSVTIVVEPVKSICSAYCHLRQPLLRTSIRNPQGIEPLLLDSRLTEQLLKPLKNLYACRPSIAS